MRRIAKAELALFQLGSPATWDHFAPMPTVCLLAADERSLAFDLATVVEGMIRIGCSYFMTWGNAADFLHDELDVVLEMIGGSALSVATASHRGEPAEDVAWFLVNAALPGETSIRCCVGYAEMLEGRDNLLGEIRRAVIG